MALTYTEAKATLDEIADRINTARKRGENARILYGQQQTELAALAAQYSSFITELNAASAADTWPQADDQKAEMDQMILDYQAQKTNVDAVVAAIDAV